jgi:hypothetical protein
MRNSQLGRNNFGNSKVSMYEEGSYKKQFSALKPIAG